MAKKNPTQKRTITEKKLCQLLGITQNKLTSLCKKLNIETKKQKEQKIFTWAQVQKILEFISKVEASRPLYYLYD